jgi:hypothetical protein
MQSVSVLMYVHFARTKAVGFHPYFIRYSVIGEYEHNSSKNFGLLQLLPKHKMVIFPKTILTILVKFP